MIEMSRMFAILLSPMVLVPAGQHVPFYSAARAPVAVDAFYVDAFPVTNREFRAFVEQAPGWRRSRVKAVFADERYLETWRDDLSPPSAQDESPVTGVSWFAARAFCRSQDQRLPTTTEWEYAAAGEDPREILDWYSKPRPKAPPAVSSAPANALGIHGLHGLVWEWTSDFADPSGAADDRFVCGGAGAGAADPRDYAAFMRYAFRGSLEARFAVGTLGFRCAKDSMP
jgi:formylglycine-generating enzyme required for sulfatase activity